ncbi:hypothetical protein VOLCADRAFT_93496 [Volvox carteri f. nagariensis]|uniref:Short-chain dehydrogenase n=1 Tax=Volvox carteri f. nagariensis TaxID=3068 RepID=D8U299_VOLCA|nr:uncharacterized protein VOLCADRAFT_93496 [Volvox carteri f. nagariensis]EFJ46094.1 hypothetical protein VOLCADRAFT_93496 [Volvox carteri f. nagariensis]|eukprot:XP_002952844.1 hypothetical protein VOLCADRAFT_93496 [Volvox carteri f. nagariensis]
MGPLSVVTGANRGIGFSLCAKLKSKGYDVVASCRKPSAELQALGVQIVEGVDVGRDGGCAPLTATLRGRQVDLLVCNAGVLMEDSITDLDLNNIREQYTQIHVNSLGPLRTYLAVRESLGPGAKVAIITSRMGSIADNGSGGDYGYRMSKAAVNMLGMNLAVDLKSAGVAVGILHPGFVATDMTKKYHGMDGVIDPEQSAADLVDIIEHRLSLETSGTFWHRNGSVLPW